jgi:Zn-dependent M28 family amino/carboxypeptidase
MFGAGANDTACGVAGGALTARPFKDSARVTTGAVLQSVRAEQWEAGLEVVEAKLTAGGEHTPLHQQQ